MAGQVESCHRLEKEQPGLDNGGKGNCSVGCKRSLGPRNDFKLISEKFVNRNDFSSTNEEISKERASLPCSDQDNK